MIDVGRVPGYWNGRFGGAKEYDVTKTGEMLQFA